MRENREKSFGVAGIGRKVATFTPGAGVGGLGVPPIQRSDIHPWRRSVGVWGVSAQLMVYATGWHHYLNFYMNPCECVMCLQFFARSLQDGVRGRAVGGPDVPQCA